MEYKIDEIFFDDELHANVRCVKDEEKKLAKEKKE